MVFVIEVCVLLRLLVVWCVLAPCHHQLTSPHCQAPASRESTVRGETGDDSAEDDQQYGRFVSRPPFKDRWPLLSWSRLPDSPTKSCVTIWLHRETSEVQALFEQSCLFLVHFDVQRKRAVTSNLESNQLLSFAQQIQKCILPLAASYKAIEKNV